MERGTVMKTSHSNLTPKSPTLRERDASFSSYLRPDKPINSEPHPTIGSGLCRALDDSNSELSIFDAHKYFNEVTNNDVQKVTISSASNSRVSPLVNPDIEHNPEQGDIRETSRYSSASSCVDGYSSNRNHGARSFHAATPTASSEVSWNSQTGLLPHPPGAISVCMRNHPQLSDLYKKIRASLSKPIWLLRRKCPCSGKKSVEVKEQTPEPKTPMPPTSPPPCPSHNQIARDSLNLKRQDLDSNPKKPIEKFTKDMETAAKKSETHEREIPITPNKRVDQNQRPQDQVMLVPKSQRFQSVENQLVLAISQPQRVLAPARPFSDGFTFPVLNPHSATSPMKLQVGNEVDEDPPRDSLEVFRPPDVELSSVSQKPIDRDLRNFRFPPSPKSRIIDDDAASDASSDLFEIESFSTQTTPPYPMINRRREYSIEEASNLDAKRSGTTTAATATITECYEPSEASIDRSVTTAGGYDRESVANLFTSASELVTDDASSTTTTSTIHGGADDRPPEKRKRKGSSGNGLLRCWCEKAVSVGPQPVKCAVAAEGHGGATATALASRHVSSRPASGNVNKR